jgi:hypothetical protein
MRSSNPFSFFSSGVSSPSLSGGGGGSSVGGGAGRQPLDLFADDDTLSIAPAAGSGDTDAQHAERHAADKHVVKPKGLSRLDAILSLEQDSTLNTPLSTQSPRSNTHTASHSTLNQPVPTTATATTPSQTLSPSISIGTHERQSQSQTSRGLAHSRSNSLAATSADKTTQQSLGNNSVPLQEIPVPIMSRTNDMADLPPPPPPLPQLHQVLSLPDPFGNEESSDLPPVPKV